MSKKTIHIPSIEFHVWWPSSHPNFRTWLPTRGNVLFTLLLVGLLVIAQSVGALPQSLLPNLQSPPSTGTIAYQGRLADADGNPLTSTVPMIFRLYDASSGGVPLWEEQWTGSSSVQVSDGLFNVMLGSLAPIPASLITSHSSLFLGITVGTDDEMAPRVQLGSVPFAVQALTVPDGSVTTEKIADGAVSPSKAPSLVQGQGSGYRVIAGKAVTGPGGGADAFFTPSFTEPPTVVAIAGGFDVQLYSQPTLDHVGFTVNSQTPDVIVHWVAIGR